jgi:hypothetical protein
LEEGKGIQERNHGSRVVAKNAKFRQYCRQGILGKLLGDI